MRRIRELDGLRGLAILMVFVFHFMWNTVDRSSRPILSELIKFGWSGVDLFFVLSGFLIGGILIDNKGSPNYFRVFYIRRFYRIIPLYFGLLILFFSARLVMTSPWLFAELSPAWTYFLFAQTLSFSKTGSINYGLGPTWSLCTEEHFYLVLPMLLFFLRRGVLFVCLVAVLGAVALRYIVYVYLPEHRAAAYWLMPCRADSLMLGVLCALGFRNERFCRWFSGEPELRALVLIVLILGVGAFAYKGDLTQTPMIESLSYLWFALLYSWLLLHAVLRTWISPLFRLPLLVYFGTLAYGVYLLHHPILGWLHQIVRGSSPTSESVVGLVVTLLAAGVTVATAHLAFKYFERPLLAYGHRYKYEKASVLLEPRGEHTPARSEPDGVQGEREIA